MDDLAAISSGGFVLLGFGLLFGLKHALEVDHVVAVSTIVSEHRSVWRASLVGALWGLGHTASLLVAGVFVLLFRIAIPNDIATWLEFGVALMIVTLGAAALWRVFRQRREVHFHTHTHDGQSHVHIHFHDHATEHNPRAVSPRHSHQIAKFGVKPLIVGAVHELAGSAALTLFLLTQVSSFALGVGYLLLFGIGSIGGMLLMSGLIGLPFALSGKRLNSFNYGLQTLAAVFSIGFGLWYAYETIH